MELMLIDVPVTELNVGHRGVVHKDDLALVVVIELDKVRGVDGSGSSESVGRREGPLAGPAVWTVSLD